MNNKCRIISLAIMAAWTINATGAATDNLIINGNFNDPEDPLKGWNSDYRWSGNSHYAKNHTKVKALQGRTTSTSGVVLKSSSEAGVKFESDPIPFELGQRYTASLKVKGGPYRIYFSGYKWKPGIRPHDAPKLEELRPLYKSKAAVGGGGSKTVKLEIPGVTLSPQAYSHLKQLRFITLYIWSKGEVTLNNVKVTKVRDSQLEKLARQ